MCPNYPTWELYVDLPAGQTVQFKALKKGETTTTTWESGSNHSYTVPTSGIGYTTITWS
ncbi:MAG: hypothetical protein LBM18_01010 [Oscillospiraceae bacterium]|nr:hypothetical protein [Oscillospiraceae bacterium]